MNINWTLAFITLLAFGCSDYSTKSQTTGNITSVKAIVNDDVKADTILTGLDNPWGMVFLPGNRMLITEREGNIRIVQNGNLTNELIQGVPQVYAKGQGGLLDIQLHPDYATNGWIYFCFAKPGKNGGSTTLSRAKLQGNSFVELQELFVVSPFISSGVHFGSRIAFDGKGFVFLSTGERGTKENAQNLGTHNGKVIRLHDDGRVPADNPFVNKPNAKPEIWTYGHRNIQGMVYDKASGILWTHEHGPKGGDEINIEIKGNNYGWPVTTHGIDYSGAVISEYKEKEGIASPIHTWVPSIAPCGMALVTTDKYPGWKGNLLVGALAGQHVAKVSVENNKVIKEEKLLNGMARFRAIVEAPDGYIYALTESPGMLLRFRN
jgi:aldose sugar dehydrogenase